MRLIPIVVFGAVLAGASGLSAQTIRRVVALSGQSAPGTSAGVVYAASNSGSPLGPPCINLSGRVCYTGSLSGPGVVSANAGALWVEGSSGTSLVARLNSSAPGAGAGATFQSFFSQPILNDSGQAAVNTLLTVVGGTAYAVYAGGPGSFGLVARAGAPAPGQGADFFQLLNVTLSNTGEAAFNGYINAANGESQWIGTPAGSTLLARRLQGLNGQAGPRPGNSALTVVLINGAGESAFGGNLVVNEFGVTVSNDSAVFMGRPGSLSMVIREGMSPVNAPAGVLVGQLESSLLSLSEGRAACPVLLTGSGVTTVNNNALVVSEGGGVRIIARESEPAPGIADGVVYGTSTLGQWPTTGVLDASGNMVFYAYVVGPGIVANSNDRGLWINRAGVNELIVRNDDQLPGVPAGVLLEIVSSYQAAGNGHVLIRAALSGNGVSSANDEALYSWSGVGTLSKVIREGDVVDVNPDPLVQDLRTVFRFFTHGTAGSRDGRARSINDVGQIAATLWFSNGTAAVVELENPAVPSCPADIGTSGGVAGADGLLNNNDFVVFIDWFFGSDSRADIGTQGGQAASDGQFNNNDFIVFIDRFFAGC